ncbi:MAG: CHC2 zinc finger domain-containing protein, partial [Methanomassiliicoccales archaeon]
MQYVKQHVDFPRFLEDTIGCKIRWNQVNRSAKICCPLPNHKDALPSFQLRKMDGNVWVYHCFGCSSGGTIIDFFMDYYGMDSPVEAIDAICEKFGFSDMGDIISKEIKNVHKRVDTSKKMEVSHI